MTRRVLIGSIVLLACLASTWAVVMHVLDRDRETAERELAADRMETLRGVARTLRVGLDAIGRDLTLASTLTATARTPDRELAALVAVKQEYVAIEVRRADGTFARATAPSVPPAVLVLATPVIARMQETALATPGELHISPGLSPDDDLPAWYRVFARGMLDGSIAVAVLDMRLVVAPPEMLRTDSSRLLVMSAHGVPAPASDAEIAAALRDDPQGPLRSLVDDARRRTAGTTILDSDTAARLGLGDSDAVAAAVPIPIDAGAPWVVALVTSTSALDARHQALTTKLALDVALGLALVLVAGAYLVRNARRAAALREKLRHTEILLRSEKLATAGQLAAGIAHEIGTPLAVARGRAEMILLRESTDATDTRNLNTIVERIDYTSHLIEQLLDYARPDPRQIDVVNVGECLRAVVDLLEPRATSKGVQLQLEAGEGSVRADAGQLQQVLVNLVMNAIDACDAGGQVTLAARRRPGSVLLEVRDDGRGIDADERAHVFDPFYTTKKRGRGTGLGLWVVAQIARTHDAVIEVDSHPGEGSRFRLVWPS